MRLPDRAAQGKALQRCPQRSGGSHRDGRSEPQGPPQAQVERQRSKGPEHQQVALHEADSLGRLVDQHEGKRDQAVDTADRDSTGEDLDEGEHGAEA